MDEQTTTDATTQDTGAEVTAQPEEQHAEAVQTPDSEPQQPEETPESTEETLSDPSDELSDYWAKKGIDISTPEGQIKAAQSYREAEQALSRKAQEAAALKKSLDQPLELDTDNELLKDLAQQQMEDRRERAIERFVNEVNLSDEQEQKFAEYLVNDQNMVELINGGRLTLSQAYKLSGVNEVDQAQVKKAGGQEALRDLANKQRATAPKGSATSNVSSTKDDPLLDVLSSDD